MRSPPPRAAFLRLLLPLLLATLLASGCGDDEPPAPPPVSPFVGTWVLDPAATVAAVEDATGDAAFAKGFETLALTLVVRPDGTYSSQANPGGETYHGTGTWAADGDDVTFTDRTQDGKPIDQPVPKLAALQGGRLRFHTSAASQTQALVLRKAP